MNGYTGSEQGVLLGNLDQENGNAGFPPTSSGTFALRRAHYLQEAQKPQLSEEAQLELIKLYRAGNPDAKRRMVAHHMQLVVLTVKRFINRGITLLDLILLGNQGLIHALESYEPANDSSFPVYAEQCIHRHIERAVEERNNPSRSASRAAMMRHLAPQST